MEEKDVGSEKETLIQNKVGLKKRTKPKNKR